MLLRIDDRKVINTREVLSVTLLRGDVVTTLHTLLSSTNPVVPSREHSLTYDDTFLERLHPNEREKEKTIHSCIVRGAEQEGGKRCTPLWSF